MHALNVGETVFIVSMCVIGYTVHKTTKLIQFMYVERVIVGRPIEHSVFGVMFSLSGSQKN